MRKNIYIHIKKTFIYKEKTSLLTSLLFKKIKDQEQLRKKYFTFLCSEVTSNDTGNNSRTI